MFAFATGWGAHYAVQSAAGRVAVSTELAKRAEAAESERQAEREQYYKLEKQYQLLLSEMQAMKANSPASKANTTNPPSGVIREADAAPRNDKRSAKKKDLREPAPVVLGDMYIDGDWSRDAKIEEKIVAYVDYVVKPGYTVKIWIHPPWDSDCQYTYEGSEEISGSGQISRWFTSSTECTVDEVHVTASSEDRKYSSIERSVSAEINFKK